MKRLTTIVLASMLPASLALAATDWNGTWAGHWANGDGTQIIFAGNSLIAVYWHGDYVDGTAAALSKDGKVVTITWPSSKAVLTRDGEKAAHAVFHEKGKPDIAFPLKLDAN
jgi:hypothetical protein